MNPTTDPALRSFVPVPPQSHFPIQNLPYGVGRRRGGERFIAVAIGEHVLDLTALEARGFLDVPALHGQRVFNSGTLNAFMAQGRTVRSEVRARISGLLHAGEPALRDNAEVLARVLVPMAEVEMLLPADIGDYTDFYSSREHATNVGSMFRGADKALMPNWLHLPVAYHGRASSVIVSGVPVRRPCGQSKPEGATTPIFGLSQSLDFELEMAAFVGPGNERGQAIPLAAAEDHLFGMVLLNDWSARDIQAWEYVPLGPFLGKNFATSISPWVVTMEALEPFRMAAPPQDPLPLPYLYDDSRATYDIHLEVHLQGEKMTEAYRICASNFKYLYWTLAQQVAHHTVGGCNLRSGDLLASGTISGPTADSRGSLLELAWRGTKPLKVGDETRTFLHDGDRVTLTGWCQGDGYRVGFGTVTALITPPASETDPATWRSFSESH
jgi:fumarylacetoacetase